MGTYCRLQIKMKNELKPSKLNLYQAFIQFVSVKENKLTKTD